MKIVNGAYRGEEAVLESMDEKHFCCSVSIKHVSGLILTYIVFQSLMIDRVS